MKSKSLARKVKGAKLAALPLTVPKDRNKLRGKMEDERIKKIKGELSFLCGKKGNYAVKC